jgi:DNA-binding MarR family transcriptional regulator
MSMSQLADHESISKPSATGIVGRLVEKGLVSRSPDTVDRRSSVVAITTHGHELIDERRRERTAYLAPLIDDLGDEDRQVLERAIELLENMVQGR